MPYVMPLPLFFFHTFTSHEPKKPSIHRRKRKKQQEAIITHQSLIRSDKNPSNECLAIPPLVKKRQLPLDAADWLEARIRIFFLYRCTPASLRRRFSATPFLAHFRFLDSQFNFAPSQLILVPIVYLGAAAFRGKK